VSRRTGWPERNTVVVAAAATRHTGRQPAAKSRKNLRFYQGAPTVAAEITVIYCGLPCFRGAEDFATTSETKPVATGEIAKNLRFSQGAPTAATKFTVIYCGFGAWNISPPHLL
jgi:hypothetical protein